VNVFRGSGGHKEPIYATLKKRRRKYNFRKPRKPRRRTPATRGLPLKPVGSQAPTTPNNLLVLRGCVLKPNVWSKRNLKVGEFQRETVLEEEVCASICSYVYGAPQLRYERSSLSGELDLWPWRRKRVGGLSARVKWWKKKDLCDCREKGSSEEKGTGRALNEPGISGNARGETPEGTGSRTQQKQIGLIKKDVKSRNLREL